MMANGLPIRVELGFGLGFTRTSGTCDAYLSGRVAFKRSTFSFARAATDEMDADSDTDLPKVTVRQVGAKWKLRTSIAGSANGAKLRRFESCVAEGFGPYVDELSARENAHAFAKFVVSKSRTSAASNRHPARPTPRQKSALPSGYIACVV